MNRGVGICALTVTLALLTVPVAAAGLWEDVIRDPELLAGVTNGRVAALADAHGVVTDVRWPGLAGQPQLPIDSHRGDHADAIDGMQWGVRLGERTYWQAEYGGEPEQTEATTLAGDFAAPGLDNVATYSIVLPEDGPGFVMSLAVPAHADPITVFWYGHITPRCNPVPAFPQADWLIPGRGGFLAFVDAGDGLLRFFRPQLPGTSTRNQAQMIFQTGAPGRRNPWNRLGDGAWTTVQTQPAYDDFHVGLPGNGEASRCAFHEADDGALSGGASVLGPANAALSWELPPSETERRVTVMAGFASRFTDSEEALERVSELQDNTKPIPAGLTAHAHRMLAQGMDAETGAVASQVDDAPPRYLVVPRHAPQILTALYAAGMDEAAETYMAWLREAVRLESEPGAPAGSLPAQLYRDGGAAAPVHVLDICAVVAFVRAAERHREHLDGDDRAEFIEQTWPAVEAAAELLSTWRDGRTRQPLPAYEPELMRDAEQPALVLSIYLALEAAAAFASAAGEPAEFWQDRLEELEASVRYAELDDTERWRPYEAIAYWPLGDLLFEEAAWESFFEAALQGIDELEGSQAAETLYHLAAYTSARDTHAETVRAAVNTHGAAVLGLERDGDAWIPGGVIADPYAAALVTNALALVNDGS